MDKDKQSTNEIHDYFVNIDGVDTKVDVKRDEEYSCLLNCLEGYYIYGIGREDDCEEEDNKDGRKD